MYWGWYFGSWVAWWPFRWRLTWIAGCRRLYLRRFDRRGLFRCCLDRCQRSQSNRAFPVVGLYLRRKHVAQRKAGLSVQSRCHDRAPNLSRRRDHGQTRRHSQAPRGVRWPPSESMPICLRTFQATSPTSTSARSERNKCRDRPTTRQPARAALAFESEQGRPESERRKDEAARVTGRERRQRQPPRRKRRSKKPNGSTTESSHHRNRAPRSKNDRKLRISVGRSRRRSWRPLYVERETRRSARSFVHLTRASALVLCRHTWCNGPDRSCDPEWARLPAVSPCRCRRRI
jgi:hypothetical protein